MEHTVTSEIEHIRKRLEEITEERTQLSANDSDRVEELVDEESQLETRLTQLEDEAMAQDSNEAEETASAQTDLTRAPRLPEIEDDS